MEEITISLFFFSSIKQQFLSGKGCHWKANRPLACSSPSCTKEGAALYSVTLQSLQQAGRAVGEAAEPCLPSQ